MATPDSERQTEQFDPLALGGSMYDFARPTGPDLLGRTADFEAWRNARLNAGVWPFSRTLHDAPAPEMDISDERGSSGRGVSLACQDYLGLTAHPAVREAAVKALRELGPHSAGSPALAGNTALSLQLEKALGEALGYEHVVLFPTGWAAGYAVIAGLVRPDDHVVMDQLAHACLQQGAMAATSHIHRHAHLDFGSVRKILKKIRAEDIHNAILVVTEGLFSMDSDVPDIAELQAACREYNATLVVDVAHDFGALGPRGGGSLAAQDLVGKVDLVMGSFSKSFCSNGGFIATKSSAVRQYLKFYGSPQTFSNALSPMQTAVILKALEIIRSPEGDVLRARLLDNAETLRGLLAEKGIRSIGVPSAIVPAYIGNEAVARVAWAAVNRRGVHTNLVEFPAVAVGSARFRMQVMASHEKAQLVHAVSVVAEALEHAKQVVADLNLPPRRRTRLTGSADFAIEANALPALKADDLKKLHDFARTEHHVAGTTIVRVGDNIGALYIVKKGQVRIEVEEHGQTITLAECGEGSLIGEVSMLDGRGASASVVAQTDVELACINHTILAALSRTDPALGMRLYQSLAVVLAQRLRNSNVARSPFGFIG